jgi:hypothetical protein
MNLNIALILFTFMRAIMLNLAITLKIEINFNKDENYNKRG